MRYSFFIFMLSISSLLMAGVNRLLPKPRYVDGGGAQCFDKRGTMLPEENHPDFKAFKEFEDRVLWHKEDNFKGYSFAYVKQTNVKWMFAFMFVAPDGSKKAEELIYSPDKIK